MCIYIYIYIGGWGEWDQPGNRFVSFVRARAVVVRWECASNLMLRVFPFPFCGAGLSLFPYETISSLFPCEQYFRMISMIPTISMISLIPMRPSESKWVQIIGKYWSTWTHLDSLGSTWTHLDSLGLTWIHLDFGLTWTHLVTLAS